MKAVPWMHRTSKWMPLPNLGACALK